MTEFLAFDDAVRTAVDFAKQEGDGDTLVMIFPDHNTGGLSIGNYLHGYKDVSVNDLIGPFQKMTRSANALVATFGKNFPSPPTLVAAVKEYWGLDISISDANAILDYCQFELCAGKDRHSL